MMCVNEDTSIFTHAHAHTQTPLHHSYHRNMWHCISQGFIRETEAAGYLH